MDRMMVRGFSHLPLLLTVALCIAGCEPSATMEIPTLNGRRVQGTSLAATGSVPFRVGAYELVFSRGSDAAAPARRAALLVDLAGGEGIVRGFVEWGRPGEAPLTYVAGGWAWEREVDGVPMTVFQLALSHVEARNTPRAVSDAARATPLAIRLVVNEASGDVTLTRHQ